MLWDETKQQQNTLHTYIIHTYIHTYIHGQTKQASGCMDEYNDDRSISPSLSLE